MAAKVKIELDHQGISDLLHSDEVMELCSDTASDAMSSLGSGYDVEQYVGEGRVNVKISAKTWKARHDAYENNSILKALMGGQR